MKSFKSLLRSNSLLANRSSRLSKSLAVALAASFFLSHSAFAASAMAATKATLETHQDLILKAQNLTLQRDRLQASQILIRGLQREKPASQAYKELLKSLTELSAVFYSEKAQDLYSLGEASTDARPKEAIDHFQEALRIEDGNVSILGALARAQLSVGDCEKADATTKSALGINPYSSELKLLSLQNLVCAKSFGPLLARLSSDEDGLETTSDSLVKNLRLGLLLQALMAQSKATLDLKKIKATLQTWETAAPDYPEVQYWKWEVSKVSGTSDRTAALKYSQLCQNLTARKRKNYSLDTNLCKGKEAVDLYLKESGVPATPAKP